VRLRAGWMGQAAAVETARREGASSGPCCGTLEEGVTDAIVAGGTVEGMAAVVPLVFLCDTQIGGWAFPGLKLEQAQSSDDPR
jgi:hypothetical protein